MWLKKKRKTKRKKKQQQINAIGTILSGYGCHSAYLSSKFEHACMIKMLRALIAKLDQRERESIMKMSVSVYVGDQITDDCEEC